MEFIKLMSARAPPGKEKQQYRAMSLAESGNDSPGFFIVDYLNS